MIELYGLPQIDRIWGIWGSYYNIPEGIFYLLKGDYILRLLHDLAVDLQNQGFSHPARAWISKGLMCFLCSASVSLLGTRCRNLCRGL